MSKALTKDNLLEIIRLFNQENLSQREIARIFGVGKSTVNDFITKKTHQKFWKKHNKKPVAGGNLEKKHIISNEVQYNKKYFITCAQNNTFVNEEFLNCIKNYCYVNDAELLISTFTYNKDKFSQTGDLPWYDEKIRDYINNSRIRLARDLVYCGEIDLAPTNMAPCNLYKTYAWDKDIIIPHVKQELLTVPVDKFTPTKVVFSTGTITQHNYVDKAIGQRAEESHTYGGLVVEVDENGTSFVRQVQFIDNKFFDLNLCYYADHIENSDHLLAVNWGDIHSAQLDPDVARVSWESKNSILDTMKPKYQFVHDVFDMQARNHHSRNNQFHRLELMQSNEDSVEDEIRHTCHVIESLLRDFTYTVIVESNHDKALEKWLDEADYRNDDLNAAYFLKLQYARYKWVTEDYQDKEKFQVFKYACDDILDNYQDKLTFLRDDETFIIAGNINCGQHGHLGNNGARGSVAAYAQRPIKYNIGHVHSPSIKGNVFAAGVSGSLDMGYNKGGSSWMHAHIFTYQNGARSIIFIKDDKFKA